MNTDEQNIEHITGEPDLEALRDELDRCLRDSGIYLDQYLFDYKTRFCLWDGQDRSGRKWDAKLGGNGRAKPWDGASDIRPFTADDIINEQTEVMMAAWARANIQVTANQSTGIDWATKVTTLLQWMFRTHMQDECDRELELAAQWRQQYGLSVLGVWWNQEHRIEQVPVTLEELMGAAMRTGSREALESVQAMLDPVMEDEIIGKLTDLSPVLDRQGARKLLRALRTGQEGQLPRVYVMRNQPCWEALRPFLDVFFPVESRCLANARFVARRRWFTETELRTKVLTEQWDEDWVTEALTKKGLSYSVTESIRELAPRATRLSLTPVDLQPNADHYVEVWDVTYPGVDERTGYPVLQRTIWSPHIMDSYARHEPIPYDHGEQPYVEFVRERIEPQMVESRSVPEIAATFQNTIKTQRDSANDFSQMSTIPTLKVPMWRSGTRLEIGPGAQIPERTAGELSFLQAPQYSGLPDRIEERAEIALGRYFGRAMEGVAPERVQMARERLVIGFMRETGRAVKMSLQLAQQYLDQVTIQRQTGQANETFHVSREEIQGQFNLTLHLDPNDLNFELGIKKLEALNKFVIPADTVGSINRAAFVRVGARIIDPYMADQIVGTPEAAAQSEVEDEKKNLAMIMSGVEPPMRSEGQNYALRLQVIQQQIQANPLLPMIVQQRPDIQAMLDARVKHLQFLAQQFGPNAQIGRVGAEPGLQTLAERGGGDAGAMPPMLGGPR